MSAPRKKYFSLSLFEVLYLSVTIAGFGLIYASVNSTEKAIHTNTYLQIYSWTNDIDKTLMEHPELKRYFDDGDSIKTTDTNYYRAEAMAELILDNFDAILGNTNYFHHDGDSKKLWLNWIYDSFTNSPILCKRMEKNINWYTPELRNAYYSWQKIGRKN